MKRFSKKGYGEEAICPSCGDWKTTDFSPAELKEREWECSDCMNKRLTSPQDLPENRGSKEISKYDPEYEFLVKLIQLVTKEGVPPQEVKALAEAHPFVTIDDVGDLSAQIWTLATEKYHIPREWLIKKLPKSASLHKKADMWRGQEETEDMINHAPGYLAYEYGQDKESKSKKKLNLDQIVKILDTKEPKVVRIDTTECIIELADGSSFTFDEAVRQVAELDKTADVLCCPKCKSKNIGKYNE